MTDPTPNNSVAEASVFFAQAAQKLLTTDGRLHAESLIASVARMSGSLLFRSYGLDQGAVPGTVVLSEQANADGAALMRVLLDAVTTLGHPITESQVNVEFASAEHAGISFKESHDRLAPFYLKYCQTAPLALRPASLAAISATGTLIAECARVLPVRNAAAVAIYGLLEGCKTVPWPVSGFGSPAAATAQPGGPGKTANPAAPKPWYKVW